jgi:RNA recognition motif-containing protein
MAFFEDDCIWVSAADVCASYRESTSIPKNPRTDRPVGYAFVDLSTPSEAERAIAELSGKEILERKVSVQLARKPEPAGEKTEGTASGGEAGGEGNRRRPSGRGRGRGRGRGGRGGRAGERTVSLPSIGTTLAVVILTI